MLKLRYFLPLVGLLLLQACQYHNGTTQPYTVNAPKLRDAAKYNAQLGLAYLHQGNRSLAKHKLLLALSQAPDAPDVNAAMAYFMEKSGEKDKAQWYYQKAMAAAPKAGAQLNNYGAFLCRQGHYRSAEKYFLLAVNDNNYEQTAGAYENAGLCVLAISDTVKATYYFRKALKQDPSRQQSLYELVTLKMKQGRTNEALAYLQAYPRLSLHDKTLLTLAVDVANKAGKTEWAAHYKMRLHDISDNPGEKNEYNNNNNG